MGSKSWILNLIPEGKSFFLSISAKMLLKNLDIYLYSSIYLFIDKYKIKHHCYILLNAKSSFSGNDLEVLYSDTCHGLTPASNQAPCSCLLTLPTRSIGQRMGRVKGRKLMDCDKGSLIGKAKAMHKQSDTRN